MPIERETLVVIGGIYCLGLVVFHLTFWKLFDWKRELASLRFINRAVMQVLNVSLIVAFLVFAIPSLFYSHEMVNTDLGRLFLLLISIFWFVRAIQQIVFFGVRNAASLAFFFGFSLGGIIYALPLIDLLWQGGG